MTSGLLKIKIFARLKCELAANSYKSEATGKANGCYRMVFEVFYANHFVSNSIAAFFQNTFMVTNDTKGITIDTQGITIDTQGITNDAQGLTIDTQGITIDTQGITNDTQGLTNDMGVPQKSHTGLVAGGVNGCYNQ